MKKQIIKLCELHYQTLIDNMIQFNIPAYPFIEPGLSGIIFNGNKVVLGSSCFKCEELKEEYEIIKKATL